ncbi:MAG: hypothetical protein ACRC62_15610 [Microcoleus sp.]
MAVIDDGLGLVVHSVKYVNALQVARFIDFLFTRYEAGLFPTYSNLGAGMNDFYPERDRILTSTSGIDFFSREDFEVQLNEAERAYLAANPTEI